jgi:hypothetical protein
MFPKAIGIMATQHGLITRRQAIDAGVSDEALRRLLSRRAWVAVRRGVYADAAIWDTLDEFLERPKRIALAASLTMTRPHVLSHESAADWLGLPILRPMPALVHVTRPSVQGSRTRFGVKHHTAAYRPDQVVEIDGFGVLDLARTAVDIAREHGPWYGVPAMDGALRRGVTTADLAEAFEAMWCWPGSTSVQTSLDLADEGAESVPESLLRIVVEGLGIGTPQTQFGIRDEYGRHFYGDIRVGRHIFEFDGRQKYLSVENGGLAEDPDRVLWLEKGRQDILVGHRLGISRVTYPQLFPPLLPQTEVRLRREYAATERLWGSSIDDLTPFLLPRRPLPRTG